MDRSELLSLLQHAVAGDHEALGQLLEWHRAWLKTIAESRLGPQLSVRCDSSDLAQLTCLSAVKNIAKFRGATLTAFGAWLRKIHECNIQNTIRMHIQAECRATGREVPREIANPMASLHLSPNQRAMQGEAAVQLAQAIQGLPNRQRHAVQLRHLDGWSLAEVARTLDTTETAVAGLLRRGLQQLRSALGADRLKSDEKGTSAN